MTMQKQAFIRSLQDIIQGDVLFDDYSLGIYSTDASVYQIRPLVVVAPKNNGDVIAAIKIARGNQVKILPRGAGTSLAGQTVGDAMVLDFSKYMNQALEINEKEKWVRVPAGRGARCAER